MDHGGMSTAAKESGTTCSATCTAAFVIDGRRASFSSTPQMSIWLPSIDRSYMAVSKD